MKTVILAGGYGTRISEESHLKPKPMIEIGGLPILWHIMKLYAHHGLDEFIICLGYKGYIIKEYFANYVLHNSDITVDARTGEITYHQSQAEPWKVTLVDTGADVMTGGRLKRVRSFLDEGKAFCMTYGDGVADVDIGALTKFHKDHGQRATMTAVIPPGRYGAIELDGERITRFTEKPPGDEGLINGGFFVLQPDVIDHIKDDDMPWEGEPLNHLASAGDLMAYRHLGFWHAMDTLRDRKQLEKLWQSGQAPWKVWK